ncbi:MAG: hypothetical protein FJ254_04000 [Phycisphaerae bacterium]|nr:hypothetical protein [Phycisphaerae bacterium]
MHLKTTALAALVAAGAAQATSQATVSVPANTSVQATVRIDITHSSFGSSNDTEQRTHTLSGSMHVTMSPNNPPWANIGQDAMNLVLGAATYNFQFFCFPFIGCQNLNVDLAPVTITMLTPASSPLSGTGNYTMSNVTAHLAGGYTTTGIDNGTYVLDRPATVTMVGRLGQTAGIAKIDQFSLGSLIIDVDPQDLPPNVTAIRLTITPNLSQVVFSGPWSVVPSPDFNGDGLVNGLDLGVLLSAWGAAQGDINSDGTTDGADLGLLLSGWTG